MTKSADNFSILPPLNYTKVVDVVFFWQKKEEISYISNFAVGDDVYRLCYS